MKTAEEFLDDNCGLFTDLISGDKYADYVSPKLLIEFAKLHVKECIQDIINNATLYLNPDTNDWEIDLPSIREAYPLTNIK